VFTPKYMNEGGDPNVIRNTRRGCPNLKLSLFCGNSITEITS